MPVAVDLASQRFGRWTAMRPVVGNGTRKWLCRCDCGTQRAVPAAPLRSGVSTSCGCKRLENLTGRVFGRITVLERTPNRQRNTMWRCRCSCGNERVVQAGSLNSGAVVSCGCHKRELATTHGGSKHPLYRVWYGMIDRCYNKTNRAYNGYGGRGIFVCKRWRESPKAFYKDMGERPLGAELDRINNDGPYSPRNCRWATPLVQSNNRRSNRLVTFRGATRSIMEWSRITGVNRRTIAQRIDLGYPVGLALSAPPGKLRKTP